MRQAVRQSLLLGLCTLWRGGAALKPSPAALRSAMRSVSRSIDVAGDRGLRPYEAPEVVTNSTQRRRPGWQAPLSEQLEAASNKYLRRPKKEPRGVQTPTPSVLNATTPEPTAMSAPERAAARFIRKFNAIAELARDEDR